MTGVQTCALPILDGLITVKKHTDWYLLTDNELGEFVCENQHETLNKYTEIMLKRYEKEINSLLKNCTQ